MNGLRAGGAKGVGPSAWKRRYVCMIPLSYTARMCAADRVPLGRACVCVCGVRVRVWCACACAVCGCAFR